MNVLLVEDEFFIRSLFAECLREDFGYKVTEAANGEEAYRLFQEDHFDAVVTDYRMPRWTGVQLVRALREDGRDIPVLMVSADLGHEAAQDCGADDYMDKPVLPCELGERVQQLLH